MAILDALHPLKVNLNFPQFLSTHRGSNRAKKPHPISFAELIPADLRPEVTMFVAIGTEKSGGTDGAMQVNGLRPDERYIAFDVSGAVAPAQLDRTMIHEYAHLLTLRDGQVDPDESLAETCEVYADPKCPLDDSYLYAFRDEIAALL